MPRSFRRRRPPGRAGTDNRGRAVPARPLVLRRLTGERGAASLELAVVFPVVLLLVMTLIQAALWFYARSVALGAAQEGAREGRVQPASTARAQSAAEGRSEEHTSELQSRQYLVCRLLLEKKYNAVLYLT